MRCAPSLLGTSSTISLERRHSAACCFPCGQGRRCYEEAQVDAFLARVVELMAAID